MNGSTPVPTLPVALTIAGSDSGGGAGIQADLKTFHTLEVFGTSAITCVTAQNPDEVRDVAALDPAIVRSQIEAVTTAFPVSAAKTGMLYSAGIIRTVADAVTACRIPGLVVDPVMIATSHARLLRDDAIEALTQHLLPLASVITPNLDEAAILLGDTIGNENDLRDATRELVSRFGVPCVIKGGHLHGREVVDVFCDGTIEREWRAPRVACDETHGTGCTFAAAVTAGLARRMALVEAVGSAKTFVAEALRRAPRVGDHRPLGIQPTAGSATPAKD